MKPTKSILILLSLFLIFSCETPVEPDTTPPTVSITSPVSGITISDIIPIVVSTNDNVEISKVEFYIDTLLVSTDIEFDTASQKTGLMRLTYLISYNTVENAVQTGV